MTEVKARMPGKVEEILVKVGDAVESGQQVAIVEAMKMKTPLAAPAAGTVKEIKAPAGTRLSTGDVIIVLE